MTAKSDPRDPSVTMTIRLPQSVKEALTEEAWSRRMTPNKYAAQILRAEVDHVTSPKMQRWRGENQADTEPHQPEPV